MACQVSIANKKKKEKNPDLQMFSLDLPEM